MSVFFRHENDLLVMKIQCIISEYYQPNVDDV